MNSSRQAASKTSGRTGWRVLRLLWAFATTLLIAALLFVPTFLWTMGVGVYMVSLLEFSGLWLLASAYVMALTPFVLGLITAGARFWPSVRHGLWIGALYAIFGFLYLDEILGLVRRISA